jgi:shikimate kinase
MVLLGTPEPLHDARVSSEYRAVPLRYWNLLRLLPMTAATAQPGSSPGAPIRVVALTGFMGCGKSTVGQALAAHLGWEFRDLDSAIEARSGRKIREIFRADGEAAFRAREHETLERLLGECGRPTVLALGGGTFVQPDNAELLRLTRVPTIFLDVPIDELLRRCEAEQQFSRHNLRPLASDEPSFRALHAERLPLYRQAELVVDASLPPEQVARAIAAALPLPRP